VARVGRLVTIACVAAMVVGCGDPPPSDLPQDTAPPVAVPQVTCLGVVPSKCADFLAEAASNGGGVPVGAIRIVCTKPPCNAVQGEVTIDVLYASGRRDSWGTGWATVGGIGQPVAPTPIAPDPTPGASG
jgi:hypothetical protein